MTKVFLGLLVFSTIFIGSALRPAMCTWCPSFRCYARCSDQCACVTVGGQMGGSCVGVEKVGELSRHGFIELK